MTDKQDSSGSLELGSISTDISTTLFRRMATLVLSFGNLFLMARVLQSEGLGFYNLALFLPMLLSTFLNSGIGAANIILIGHNRFQSRTAFRANIILWAVLSIIGVILAFPLISLFGDSLFPDVPPLFLWLALTIYPWILLLSYLMSLLRSIQDFVTINLIAVWMPLLTFTLLVVLVYWQEQYVTGALIAYGLSQISGIVIAIYRLQQKMPASNDGENSITYMRPALIFGWKSNIGTLIAFLNYRVDLYLINILLNPGAVGLYFAAVRLVELLWIPSDAVTTILSPKIASMFAEEDNRQRLTPLLVRVTLLITLAFSLAMLLLGFPFFALMGSDFPNSYPVFLALLPGAILITISKVLANDLAARGHLKYNAYTAGITLLIEILFIFLLAPSLHLIGIALATTIAYGQQAFVSLYFYTKVTGLTWWHIFIPGEMDRLAIQQGRDFLIGLLSRIHKNNP